LLVFAGFYRAFYRIFPLSWQKPNPDSTSACYELLMSSYHGALHQARLPQGWVTIC